MNGTIFVGKKRKNQLQTTSQLNGCSPPTNWSEAPNEGPANSESTRYDFKGHHKINRQSLLGLNQYKFNKPKPPHLYG
jgi:hypothetical protein